MALGIEQNNLAPQMIQNSGAALVQGIRQIGQQISGHITELQTKRDLGALAQEMQGVNPASTEFPVQLTQLVSRHPMAAKDERGQMLLGVLGKAHGQWQASQADALAFERQMKMLETREAGASARAAAAETARRGRPVSVTGVGLVDPLTQEVIVPEKPRMSAGAMSPRVLSPGAVMVDPTGKKLAENPKPAGSSSEARMLKKNNIDLLLRQDSATQREIDAAIKRLDDIQKQDLELSKDEAVVGKPKKDFLVTTAKAIQEEVKALRERREKIRKSIEAIELVPAEEAVLGAAPELVPPGITPAAPGANVRRVRMIDPNGKLMNLREDQVDAAIQSGWKQG